MRETEVNKTRKAHACEWCPEPIKVGEKAHGRAYVWEGEFHHGYMHPECWEALCRSEAEDGFPIGEQDRGVAYNCYDEPIPIQAQA